MQKLAALFLFLLLASCASRPPVSTPKSEPVITTPTNAATRPQQIVIDYPGLQQSLGLVKADETLGYFERAFNTCEAGFGYPSDSGCRRDFFVLIHFRLLCRDAHESNYSAFDSTRMQALSGRAVRWNLPGNSGQLVLDGEGQGQIRLTARNSQRAQRLRLNADNEVLYIRAGEISRVVAPPDWCR